MKCIDPKFWKVWKQKVKEPVFFKLRWFWVKIKCAQNFENVRKTTEFIFFYSSKLLSATSNLDTSSTIDRCFNIYKISHLIILPKPNWLKRLRNQWDKTSKNQKWSLTWQKCFFLCVWFEQGSIFFFNYCRLFFPFWRSGFLFVIN